MNYEKLKKKREKRRQRILREFGSQDLRILSADVLLKVQKIVRGMNKDYVKGAGSVFWSLKENYFDGNNKIVIAYLTSLPYVKNATIKPYDEQSIEKENGWYEDLVVTFVKPDIEKSDK